MPDATHHNRFLDRLTDQLEQAQNLGAIAILDGLIGPLQDIATAVMPHDTHKASGVLMAVECVIEVRDRLVAEQDA